MELGRSVVREAPDPWQKGMGLMGGQKVVCKVENKTLGGSVGAVCWRPASYFNFFSCFRSYAFC